jgi:transcriptional regulator of aromatic amino acid metabolism
MPGSQGKYTNSVLEDIAKLALDGIQKNKEIASLKITNEMWLKIFDALDEIVYAVDLKTYKILYANKAAKKLIGDNMDKPCYEALQGLTCPCSFCKNDELKEYYQVVKWQHTNLIDGKPYKVLDMKIPWHNGIDTDAKFEIAILIKDDRQTDTGNTD